MIFFKFHTLIIWTGLGGWAAATGMVRDAGSDMLVALALWGVIFLFIAVTPARDPE